MYCKADQPKLTPENFELPKETKLSADNRWVIMAELIPWSELARSRFGGNLRRVARQFEEQYAENFSEKMGAPAKSFRMALGTLIILDRARRQTEKIIDSLHKNRIIKK